MRTSLMVHQSEHSTKIFLLLGTIPRTIPGKMPGFDQGEWEQTTEWDVLGTIPRKMPGFQSATVVCL